MAGLGAIEGVMHLAGVGLRAWVERALRDAMDPTGARRRKLARIEAQLQRYASALEWHHVGEPLIDLLGTLDREIAVLAIDSAREPRVHLHQIASGTADHVDIPVERVCALTRHHGAGSLCIMAHNHPSGDDGEAPMPSAGDHRGAIELRSMLRDLDVELDEVVICRDSARIVRASRLGARYARRHRR